MTIELVRFGIIFIWGFLVLTAAKHVSSSKYDILEKKGWLTRAKIVHQLRDDLLQFDHGKTQDTSLFDDFILSNKSTVFLKELKAKKVDLKKSLDILTHYLIGYPDSAVWRQAYEIQRLLTNSKKKRKVKRSNDEAFILTAKKYIERIDNGEIPCDCHLMRKILQEIIQDEMYPQRKEIIPDLVPLSSELLLAPPKLTQDTDNTEIAGRMFFGGTDDSADEDFDHDIRRRVNVPIKHTPKPYKYKKTKRKHRYKPKLLEDDFSEDSSGESYEYQPRTGKRYHDFESSEEDSLEELLQNKKMKKFLVKLVELIRKERRKMSSEVEDSEEAVSEVGTRRKEEPIIIAYATADVPIPEINKELEEAIAGFPPERTSSGTKPTPPKPLTEAARSLTDPTDMPALRIFDEDVDTRKKLPETSESPTTQGGLRKLEPTRKALLQEVGGTIPVEIIQEPDWEKLQENFESGKANITIEEHEVSTSEEGRRRMNDEATTTPGDFLDAIKEADTTITPEELDLIASASKDILKKVQKKYKLSSKDKPAYEYETTTTPPEEIIPKRRMQDSIEKDSVQKDTIQDVDDMIKQVLEEEPTLSPSGEEKVNKTLDEVQQLLRMDETTTVGIAGRILGETTEGTTVAPTESPQETTMDTRRLEDADNTDLDDLSPRMLTDTSVPTRRIVITEEMGRRMEDSSGTTTDAPRPSDNEPVGRILTDDRREDPSTTILSPSPTEIAGDVAGTTTEAPVAQRIFEESASEKIPSGDQRRMDETTTEITGTTIPSRRMLGPDATVKELGDSITDRILESTEDFKQTEVTDKITRRMGSTEDTSTEEGARRMLGEATSTEAELKDPNELQELQRIFQGNADTSTETIAEEINSRILTEPEPSATTTDSKLRREGSGETTLVAQRMLDAVVSDEVQTRILADGDTTGDTETTIDPQRRVEITTGPERRVEITVGDVEPRIQMEITTGDALRRMEITTGDMERTTTTVPIVETTAVPVAARMLTESFGETTTGEPWRTTPEVTTFFQTNGEINLRRFMKESTIPHPMTRQLFDGTEISTSQPPEATTQRLEIATGDSTEELIMPSVKSRLLEDTSTENTEIILPTRRKTEESTNRFLDEDLATLENIARNMEQEHFSSFNFEDNTRDQIWTSTEQRFLDAEGISVRNAGDTEGISDSSMIALRMLDTTTDAGKTEETTAPAQRRQNEETTVEPDSRRKMETSTETVTTGVEIENSRRKMEGSTETPTTKLEMEASTETATTKLEMVGAERTTDFPKAEASKRKELKDPEGVLGKTFSNSKILEEIGEKAVTQGIIDSIKESDLKELTTLFNQLKSADQDPSIILPVSKKESVFTDPSEKPEFSITSFFRRVYSNIIDYFAGTTQKALTDNFGGRKNLGDEPKEDEDSTEDDGKMSINNLSVLNLINEILTKLQTAVKIIKNNEKEAHKEIGHSNNKNLVKRISKMLNSMVELFGREKEKSFGDESVNVKRQISSKITNLKKDLPGMDYQDDSLDKLKTQLLSEIDAEQLKSKDPLSILKLDEVTKKYPLLSSAEIDDILGYRIMPIRRSQVKKMQQPPPGSLFVPGPWRRNMFNPYMPQVTNAQRRTAFIPQRRAVLNPQRRAALNPQRRSLRPKKKSVHSMHIKIRPVRK